MLSSSTLRLQYATTRRPKGCISHFSHSATQLQTNTKRPHGPPCSLSKSLCYLLLLPLALPQSPSLSPLPPLISISASTLSHHHLPSDIVKAPASLSFVLSSFPLHSIPDSSLSFRSISVSLLFGVASLLSHRASRPSPPSSHQHRRSAATFRSCWQGHTQQHPRAALHLHSPKPTGSTPLSSLVTTHVYAPFRPLCVSFPLRQQVYPYLLHPLSLTPPTISIGSTFQIFDCPALPRASGCICSVWRLCLCSIDNSN